MNVRSHRPAMSVRSTILAQIEEIARKDNIKLPPLSDDLSLADTGLDSLNMAVLVATLEDKVGVDPFTAADEARFPVTVGDFVAMYDDALA